MADHDPMCLSREFLPADLPRFCDCERVLRVRADERERMTLPEWTQVVADARASAEAEVRERIAQEIERTTPRMKTDRYLLISIEHAARIARGDS